MYLCDDTKNIETELNENKQKLEDYQKSILQILSENKNFKNEFVFLRNKESEKQSIVKNNEILISEFKTHLKEAQEKYEALVKEKDIEFQNTSKKISELADIKTTVATVLMKMLGLKLKLNNIENNIWEVKYYFNNNMEISMYYNNVDHKFILESITPTPVRFDLMKEFLHKTQDIPGFLYNANNFFFKLQNQN